MDRAWLVLWVATLAGCLDAPVPIGPLGGGAPSASLAALGVFTDPPSAQLPASGVVAYDVVAPLYSDEALKRRFVWLPPDTRMHAHEDGTLELPTGAVLVKTFSFPIDARDPSSGERLIETRFLVRTEAGYVASTYLWNDAQTDAIASGGERDVPVHWIDAEGRAHDQLFHVPGTSRCQDCHQQRALGMRAAQLDRDGQLDRFVALGLLDARPTTTASLVDPYDVSAPLDARARSYLDANCGLCHAEGQSAAGTHVLWDLAHTESQLPICQHTSAVDGCDRVIAPGSPDASEMLARMRSTDPFVHMPRGPSRLADARGLALIADWIASMDGGCP